MIENPNNDRIKPDWLLRAEAIAREAHTGQRRWGGEPYVTHVEAVAKSVSSLGPEYEAAAWLHDVLEDHGDIWTPAKLQEQGIPTNVVSAVCLLSRSEGESYLTFVLSAATDPISRAVKMADLDHNLSTLGGAKNKSMKDKYIMAKWILENKP